MSNMTFSKDRSILASRSCTPHTPNYDADTRWANGKFVNKCGVCGCGCGLGMCE